MANWSFECKKFVQTDDLSDWTIVPMTIDFHNIYVLEPDSWIMNDGKTLPVFRLEYMFEDGIEVYKKVSYILTDFNVIVK